MKAALKKAKQKGLTRIELTVRENNASAIALYGGLDANHRNFREFFSHIENTERRLIAKPSLY